MSELSILDEYTSETVDRFRHLLEEPDDISPADLTTKAIVRTVAAMPARQRRTLVREAQDEGFIPDDTDYGLLTLPEDIAFGVVAVGALTPRVISNPDVVDMICANEIPLMDWEAFFRSDQPT
ncbi:MAG: hypothetical protein JWL85_96 [Candidatus Saccharibacteria bacterium]|nr:hypothetical protein [Candidatus Saccharibacteria bacterium]